MQLFSGRLFSGFNERIKRSFMGTRHQGGRRMSMPVYRSVERQATRMHQMMDRLAVDPRALVRLRNGDAYAEARSRCLSCVASESCLRWLDGYVMTGSTPDFCPNLRLFRPCSKAHSSC